MSDDCRNELIALSIRGDRMMTDDSTDRANPKDLSPVEVVEKICSPKWAAKGHLVPLELKEQALENAHELERLRDRMALLRALHATEQGLPITEDECKRALAAITRMGSETKSG